MGWPEELRGPMLLGSISPDAYRITPGAGYRDTHFRHHTKLGQRQGDFVRRYLHPAFEAQDGSAQAFYAGWMTHLCADDVWRQRLRTELKALWDGVNHSSSEQAKQLKHIYRANCARVDAELVRQLGPQVQDIVWHLGEANAELNVGPIQVAAITRWKQKTLIRNFNRPFDEKAPQIIDHNFVMRAMTAAEDEAASILLWEARATEPSVLIDSDIGQ
jgi:hypothetical protein